MNTMVYRILVAGLATLCTALALAAYAGYTVNRFYFPGSAPHGHWWAVLGLALLATILFAEAFWTALPRTLRRKPSE